jgi:cytochrome c oxidase assembly protein subunit 15
MAIAVTGATVRLTGSGLGCSDWPTCEPGQFVAPWEFHAQVEFINRLITGVVSISAGVVLVLALRVRPRRRHLVALAATLVAGIFVQAIVGALVTKSDLLPNWVAVHYLISAVLVATATVLWNRSRASSDEPPAMITRPFIRGKGLQLALGIAGSAVLISGPLVTGSGPHAGDENATRLGFDLGSITRVHSLLAWLFVGLVVTTMVFAARAVRSGSGGDALGLSVNLQRIQGLAFVAVLQGGIGYLQYFTQLPPVLVGAHVAGSMLVVASLTLVLDRFTPNPQPTAAVVTDGATSAGAPAGFDGLAGA